MRMKPVAAVVAMSAFSVALMTGVCAAQLSNVAPPPAPGMSGAIPIPGMHDVHGYDKPVTGLPYSLLATTTTVQTLGDGTSIKNVHAERRMRDTEGRTRTEASHMVNGEMKLEFITINDPVAHTRTMLNPRDKTATVVHMPERTPPTPEQEAERQARMQQEHDARAARLASDPAAAAAAHSTTLDKLGTQNVAGVMADGSRMTHVVPVGKEGNDHEIRSVHEMWFSPELKIEVGSMHDDPRMGKSTMVVTELARTNPSSDLFQAPSDYTVIQAPEHHGMMHGAE